jgi:DNA-binding MarR family transcriptional regulator
MPERPNRIFGRSLPMSLLRARETVVQRFRPMLRRHGLNDQQWRVLRVLAERTEVTATDPVLEARGLLRRKTGTTDQRHSLIALAPAGRALFEQVAEDFELIYAQMAQDFGQARLTRLHAELEALRQVLS